MTIHSCLPSGHVGYLTVSSCMVLQQPNRYTMNCRRATDDLSGTGVPARMHDPNRDSGTVESDSDKPTRTC